MKGEQMTETKTLKAGDVFERTFTVSRAAADGDGAAQTYRASFSSETPAEQWFGTEILSHAPEAVNMERAVRGLPLLFNHDPDEHIGRALDVRLDGRRLVGGLRFSRNGNGPRFKADVDDGMLGDVSIRYSIDEYTTETDEHQHDTYTITRWTPLEVSIVTVPADHTVGVGRSFTPNKEGKTMEPVTAASGGKTDGGTVNVVEFKDAFARGAAEGAASAAQAERQRAAEIGTLFASARFASAPYVALRDRLVAEGSTVEQARIALLQMVSTDATAEPTGTRSAADDTPARILKGQRFEVGQTAGDKAGEACRLAIEARANLITGEEARKATDGNDFAALSLVEMAREWARHAGLRVAGKSKMDLVGYVFTEGKRDAVGMGIADFTGILANVASKSLLMGWANAETTWQQVAKTGSLSDFKRTNRTGLANADLLDKMPAENGEYKFGKNVDRTEYLTLSTFGKLFRLARAAIINDDLGAFTTIPSAMGLAAAQTVNKEFVDMLVSASGVGPTLNQDATALFHANHNNYDATSGSITVANVDTARQRLRRQKDPNNNRVLNITPAILYVPSTLETTANVLVASEKDPFGLSGATGGAQAANPFLNKLRVVAEPALDDATNGTTAWYVFADPNRFDTFEVAFLDGQTAPFLESKDGWSSDGVEYKVRLDFVPAALDFRGVYRKRGA